MNKSRKQQKTRKALSCADFKSRGDRIRTRQYLPSKTPINQCFQCFEPFSVSCFVTHGNPLKQGLCQITFYPCLINLRHERHFRKKRKPRQGLSFSTSLWSRYLINSLKLMSCDLAFSSARLLRSSPMRMITCVFFISQPPFLCEHSRIYHQISGPQARPDIPLPCCVLF